ncbi:hypothetical protein B9J90_17535 [Vibrio sp. V09_P4A23P171]|uniref:hypothetical protein n=1 Tax=Vibrio TaxID=662 RepID=UPI000B8E6A76|nr:hypothetical protein [Vibrio sp. V09_P4A23P171]EGR1738247.1 hypothetical protein [Vibrio parahaemolyticus]EGR2205683.1 hypothetical protein [Vibrio parahaemolyticus]NVJ61637.1 hypothetical protein [Gammaproteobacteria bacterium]OXX32149.1 hypothetical protein B9J90_17535 [Vibrio sp. V09_P4A23P171]
MNQEAFLLKVSKALSGCQMVEMELKIYLGMSCDLVRKRLGERLPFNLDASNFENMALERLIHTFKQFNNNAELQKKLVAFKNERNFLAHNAISNCTDRHNGFQEWDALKLDDRLQQLEQVSAELFREIHAESGKFMGYLYFEDAINNS